jgi:hypothetical protein
LPLANDDYFCIGFSKSLYRGNLADIVFLMSGFVLGCCSSGSSGLKTPVLNCLLKSFLLAERLLVLLRKRFILAPYY